MASVQTASKRESTTPQSLRKETRDMTADSLSPLAKQMQDQIRSFSQSSILNDRQSLMTLQTKVQFGKLITKRAKRKAQPAKDDPKPTSSKRSKQGRVLDSISAKAPDYKTKTPYEAKSDRAISSQALERRLEEVENERAYVRLMELEADRASLLRLEYAVLRKRMTDSDKVCLALLLKTNAKVVSKPASKQSSKAPVQSNAEANQKIAKESGQPAHDSVTKGSTTQDSVLEGAIAVSQSISDQTQAQDRGPESQQLISDLPGPKQNHAQSSKLSMPATPRILARDPSPEAPYEQPLDSRSSQGAQQSVSSLHSQCIAAQPLDASVETPVSMQQTAILDNPNPRASLTADSLAALQQELMGVSIGSQVELLSPGSSPLPESDMTPSMLTSKVDEHVEHTKVQTVHTLARISGLLTKLTSARAGNGPVEDKSPKDKDAKNEARVEDGPEDKDDNEDEDNAKQAPDSSNEGEDDWVVLD